MRFLILFLALCAPALAANFFYPVTAPIKQWPDTRGAPLSNGYIYFGVANQNPQTNPITMYWDAGGLIPAAQPFRTTGGYITRQGTPANVYAAGDFSVSVFTSSGTLVFTQPTSVDLQLALSIAGSSSAAAIPVADAGNYYTHPTTVESAFAQLGPVLSQIVTALAGTVPTGTVADYAGTPAQVTANLPGWLVCGGTAGAPRWTIGSAASLATARANADTQALYTLLWNGYVVPSSLSGTLSVEDNGGNTVTPGISAANDFAAARRLQLPDCRGRVRAGLDNMGGVTASRLTGATSGVTGTSLGAAGSSQSHTLITAELASHTHTFTGTAHNHGIADPGHLHQYTAAAGSVGTSGGGPAPSSTFFSTTDIRTTGITINNTTAAGTNSSTGSGTAFSVVQPTIVFSTIIKL